MGSFRIWSASETTKWFKVDGYNEATYQNARGYQSGKNIVFIYAAPGIHVPGVGDVFPAIGRDASQGNVVTNVNTLVTQADCRTVVTSYPGLPKGILPGDPRITGTPMTGVYAIPNVLVG